MKPIVIVGSRGRMAQELQKILNDQTLAFSIYSPNSKESVQDFQSSSGVIDFSKPEATPEVIRLARAAKVPLICGTTGWKSEEEKRALFEEAAAEIPIVLDSNFSLGIELLCRSCQILAKNLEGPFIITDIHHRHKKDAPSGTALKIAKRMKDQKPGLEIQFKDMRIGEIPGEHRVMVAWKNESIEFIHRASSRSAFAEGAVKALNWASKQKPGLYEMKDMTT